MCDKCSEQGESLIDLGTQRQSLPTNTSSALPQIATEVIDEVANCVHDSIEHAAVSEKESAKAYNDTTQSIIDRYLEQLNHSDLPDEQKKRIQSDINALHDKQGTKDSEIRSENTKRFKQFLKSITKIAFVAGGIYALKLTLNFLKEVVKAYSKA